MSPQSVPRRLSKAREPHRASESNMIRRRFKETICEVDMASPAAFGQLEGVANGPSPRQVCRDDDSHARLLGHGPARCGLTAVISVHSLDSEFVCCVAARSDRLIDTLAMWNEQASRFCFFFWTRMRTGNLCLVQRERAGVQMQAA